MLTRDNKKSFQRESIVRSGLPPEKNRGLSVSFTDLRVSFPALRVSFPALRVSFTDLSGSFPALHVNALNDSYGSHASHTFMRPGHCAAGHLNIFALMPFVIGKNVAQEKIIQ